MLLKNFYIFGAHLIFMLALMKLPFTVLTHGVMARLVKTLLNSRQTMTPFSTTTVWLQEHKRVCYIGGMLFKMGEPSIKLHYLFDCKLLLIKFFSWFCGAYNPGRLIYFISLPYRKV